jgi:hydroxyacylglutathione hydrolase
VLTENPEKAAQASRLTAFEFEQRRSDVDGLQIVDIRNPGEVALGSVEGASQIPVGQLPGRLNELDPAAPTLVFCAGGYRSSVAASVLREAGFADVSDLIGGYDAWVEVVPA